MIVNPTSPFKGIEKRAVHFATPPNTHDGEGWGPCGGGGSVQKSSSEIISPSEQVARSTQAVFGVMMQNLSELLQLVASNVTSALQELEGRNLDDAKRLLGMVVAAVEMHQKTLGLGQEETKTVPPEAVVSPIVETGSGPVEAKSEETEHTSPMAEFTGGVIQLLEESRARNVALAEENEQLKGLVDCQEQQIRQAGERVRLLEREVAELKKTINEEAEGLARLRKLRILAIDDDSGIRGLLNTVFAAEKLQHSVTTAATGAEGLELAKTGNFDVIFSGDKGQGLSGIEIAKTLRGLGDKTPVVLYTATGIEKLLPGLSTLQDVSYVSKTSSVVSMLLSALTRAFLQTLRLEEKKI